MQNYTSMQSKFLAIKKGAEAPSLSTKLLITWLKARAG
jgi:hypothetical protein